MKPSNGSPARVKHAPRLVATLEGAPRIDRCEACLRSAKKMVTLDMGNRRLHIAVCDRHGRMAAHEPGRLLAQRANRDRYFAEPMARMAEKAAARTASGAPPPGGE